MVTIETMTDTVSIRDLRVSAVIGAYDWERAIEQALVFAVEMPADAAKAAADDNLVDATDYSAVVRTVKTVVIEGKFQLIETAAERVAQRLLADYRLDWVRIEVVKPITADGYTAVITIERDSPRHLLTRGGDAGQDRHRARPRQGRHRQRRRGGRHHDRALLVPGPG